MTVAREPVSVSRRAQFRGGTQLIDGCSSRRKRRRIRLVVVDHGHPSAVCPPHQMQRVSVHRDVPRRGRGRGADGVEAPAADDAPASVRLTEPLHFRFAAGRPRLRQERDERRPRSRREQRCQQPPSVPWPRPVRGGCKPTACGRCRTCKRGRRISSRTDGTAEGGRRFHAGCHQSAEGRGRSQATDRPPSSEPSVLCTTEGPDCCVTLARAPLSPVPTTYGERSGEPA